MLQKKPQTKKQAIPNTGDQEGPKNPTFGNDPDAAVDIRSSFKNRSEMQKINSKAVLNKAKRVELDMTNTEISLAQKSIKEQIQKSAELSKNKLRRERVKKRHEEIKANNSVSENSVQELKIQPPVSILYLIFKSLNRILSRLRKMVRKYGQN